MNYGRFLICVALAALVASQGGCLLHRPANSADAEAASAAVFAQNRTTAVPPDSPITVDSATSSSASGESSGESAQARSDREELAKILREIEQIGETDPDLQRELMASLREVMQQTEADPLLWSRLRGTVMAAISYRKQVAEREAQQASAAEQPPTVTPDAPSATVTNVAVHLEPASPEAEQATEETAPVPSAEPLQQPAGFATSIQPSEEQPAESTIDKLQALADAEQKRHDTAERLAALQRNPWSFNTEGGLVSAGDDAEDPLISSLSADWQEHLRQAITALEEETEHAPQTAEEINRHAALRMLYMLSGNREKAVDPITGISPALQDFWSNELYGLAVYRDTETIPDPSRRATAAAQHLRRAEQRLGEAAILEVRNLAFCQSARGFGLYEPFESRTFNPNQQVVLYLEVDNFRTEPSELGHALSLSGSYRILDQRGQVQFDGKLGEYKEQCRTRRRDLYYSNLIRLPGSLAPGDYTMQVEVEDNMSRKMAQASIDFAIAGR